MLPETDRIARHLSSRHWKEAPDGKVTINHTTFLPREDWPKGHGPEKYVSCNRVDCFHGADDERIFAVSKCIKGKRTITAGCRIGIVTVKDIHFAGKVNGRSLTVKVIDQRKCESYSGIFGLNFADELAAQELARRARLVAFK